MTRNLIIDYTHPLLITVIFLLIPVSTCALFGTSFTYCSSFLFSSFIYFLISTYLLSCLLFISCFFFLLFLLLSTPEISYSHSLRWLKVCTPGHLLSHSLASVLGKVSGPFHNHNLSLTPLPYSSSLYTSYFETWDYSVARRSTFILYTLF
uniref:Uncharacterized protein n=1 Tax=Cacopsylla melanoneura TaxID=428564 RepID=A0A8D8X517_9HEMI